MIRQVAIIGMGALGMMYGEHIISAMGKNSVSFILDDDRFTKNKNRIFTCNGLKIDFPMQHSSEKKSFDLVIVAVKYTSLKQALETMKNCIGPDTIIVSVMNGIDSEEIIGKCFGDSHMIYTVAQAMDAMRDGTSLKYTKKGILCIGKKKDQDASKLNAVADFFDSIRLPYHVEKDILYRIWAKWMLNVGINQTCAVFDTTYRETLSQEEPFRYFTEAMHEVLLLSKSEGINLSDSEPEKYIEIIKTLDPNGYPSMAQDRKAKRPSELEMFAGKVLELAKKHGIKAPVNEYLYSRMKEIEAAY